MDGQDEQDARDERQPRDARGDKAEERRAAAELAQARLRASIDGTRAELVSTLGELRGVVAGQLDWREWVRRHPLLCMAVVAGVGFRLGRGRD